jgi:hypothetical protein
VIEKYSNVRVGKSCEGGREMGRGRRGIRRRRERREGRERRKRRRR